jgi:hypothetical protein
MGKRVLTKDRRIREEKTRLTVKSGIRFGT